MAMKVRNAKAPRSAPLKTPTELASNAVKEVSGALNILLADMFSLYLKTKNFHWHMSGPHFRDYHLLLAEQANEIFTAEVNGWRLS
jgi:starvation-inducible DNA-binding protein